VSGSHVAIITWLVMLLVGRRPGAIALCFGALIIAAYTLLAGAEPPAVRSAIMGIAAMVGVRRERDAKGLNLLLLSMLLIIVLDPLSSISGGFFLSCTATLALVVLAPRCRAAIDRCVVHRTWWKSIVADGISVSWAATLGVTLPATLAFGSVSFMAPLANLFVVPLMSGAMLMAMGVALAPAALVSKALSWWLTLLVWCADAISRALAIEVLSGEGATQVVLIAMVYSLVLAWPMVARSWVSLLTRMAAGGVVLVILISMYGFIPSRGSTLHVVERRSGVAITRLVGGRLQIVVVGVRHAPVDVPLLRWAQSKHPNVVVGLGPWGRRMKGAILHPPRDSIGR
ncbi:MAG: ComEC/Rec2 family competence protein, partial [Candidatus Kapaibacterium sp.]